MTAPSWDPLDVKLQRLNAVRLMISHCILQDGYSFPSGLDAAIVLSPVGEIWAESLRAQFPGIEASDVKAALLGEFAIGDDFTFDPQRSDFESARAVLSQDVANGRIHYPWVFGRELDDAYIRMHGNNPQNALPHTESLALLGQLPQGVFQVADVTVGPLGMVIVPETRCLVPTTCGPAIECLDPGCIGIHHSMLKTGNTVAGRAYQWILPEVPVDRALARLISDLTRPDDEYYRIDNRWSLPWLLANGLSEVERKVVLRALLKDNCDGIRDFVGRHLGAETAARGAAQIAAAVDGAVLFQTLMAVTDQSLVLALEDAVDQGQLVIGATEVRRPVRPKHEDGGTFRAVAQASRLGVRFSPADHQKAPVALKHLIATVYRENKPDELGWRLRAIEGDDDMTKLSRFMRTTAPREVVRKLITDDREILRATFTMLRYGRSRLPRTDAEEQEMIDRLLWKIGYPLDAPESPEHAVIDYTAQLRRADRVDEIRSVGSNLFASLEDLLSSTLRYVCWVLLADHFTEQRQRRFAYRRSRAERFLQEVMSDPTAVPQKFSYDLESRNPLGVLIQSLRVLAGKCQAALENPQDNIRPAEQEPFFSAKAGESIYTFPFAHTRLILDLSAESSQHLLSALSEAASVLENGKVVAIRNRLVHHTENFPAAIELSDACAAVEKAIGILVENGLLPAVYIRVEETLDQFHNKITKLSDGEGRIVEIVSPSELDLCGLPELDRPQMIVTGARIAGTGEPVRLRYEEETEFTAMWDDYLTDASQALDVQQLL